MNKYSDRRGNELKTALNKYREQFMREDNARRQTLKEQDNKR